MENEELGITGDGVCGWAMGSPLDRSNDAEVVSAFRGPNEDPEQPGQEVGAPDSFDFELDGPPMGSPEEDANTSAVEVPDGVEPDPKSEVLHAPGESIETYEWIKKSDGFTALYDHPKHGRVLVVAYIEVSRNDVYVRFNGAVDGVGLFYVAALDEFERRGDGTRFTVKLLPSKEGTVVRRWGTMQASGKDDPRFSRKFVIRGGALVKR